MNIFDYIFETGVAYLEFLLQPDPVDCGFKFGYFFVKTKIDVALEFYLKLFTSLISSSFPGRFFFLSRVGVQIMLDAGETQKPDRQCPSWSQRLR